MCLNETRGINECPSCSVNAPNLKSKINKVSGHKVSLHLTKFKFVVSQKGSIFGMAAVFPHNNEVNNKEHIFNSLDLYLAREVLKGFLAHNAV